MSTHTWCPCGEYLISCLRSSATYNTLRITAVPVATAVRYISIWIARIWSRTLLHRMTLGISACSWSADDRRAAFAENRQKVSVELQQPITKYRTSPTQTGDFHGTLPGNAFATARMIGRMTRKYMVWAKTMEAIMYMLPPWCQHLTSVGTMGKA